MLARVCLPLALLFILTACGSSTKAPPVLATRLLQGPGFRFSIPPGWAVERRAGVLAARHGKAVVSATTFTLLKRYDPSLYSKAAAELDRNITRLAAQAHGTLTEKTTTTVGGREVRAYRYTAGGFETRLGFVLQGKREVQLLCRSPAGAPDPDGACALLFHTFRLGAA